MIPRTQSSRLKKKQQQQQQQQQQQKTIIARSHYIISPAKYSKNKKKKIKCYVEFSIGFIILKKLII